MKTTHSFKGEEMKISTRILISLLFSLGILGGSIVSVSYLNTLKNEQMFLEEYKKKCLCIL